MVLLCLQKCMKGKKRELVFDSDEEKNLKKKVKKYKKFFLYLDIKCKILYDELVLLKLFDSMVVDNELKSVNRGKILGKKFIIFMLIKCVFMIKLEKLKKGNFWFRDCVFLFDFWLFQEDVVLCVMVYEYGFNWSLVSEIFYGMIVGGVYRGRYCYFVYCCERYREFMQ